MMTNNPFSVLGLDPRALKGLSDVQIDILIKGVANTLHKICHPDVSGGKKSLTARSIEINKAMEQLDRKKYPEAFSRWKQDFLKAKPMRQKLEERYGENAQLKAELRKSYLSMMDYFENWFFSTRPPVTRLNIQNMWTRVSAIQWIKSERSAPVDAFFTIEVDSNYRVISHNGQPVKAKKVLLGSIEEGCYKNIVSPKLREFILENNKREKLAGEGQPIGRTIGPIIGRDVFCLIAPYIKYGVVEKGYIIAMSEAADDNIVFRIEGLVRSATIVVAPSG